MNRKKKYLIISINILLVLTTCLYVFISDDNEKLIISSEENNKNILNTNALTMMYETGYQSGEYQVSSDTSWPQSGYTFNATLSRCENGSTLIWDDENKKVSIQANTSDKCYVYFDVYVTLYSKLLLDNPTKYEREDFSIALSSTNTGVLYFTNGRLTEDGSTVYYFAGNALNNWVKFGKNENDEDLYWRIIRTNEDKSIRLLYSGTSPNTSNGFIGKTSIGYTSQYKYDYPSEGSDLKLLIDNWYSTGLNIKTDNYGIIYDSYVSKIAMYCNDYLSYDRLVSNKTPSYKCSNSSYNYSVSNKKGGNGELEYPVATITADEVSFAGGVDSTTAQTWYYYNSDGESITGSESWWTMTPHHTDPDLAKDYNFVVGASNPGILSSEGELRSLAVRPVISLKSCVQWISGNGAYDNPYEVSIDTSCSITEN